MGRKIPGRKHHGVRDPEKQRAERLKKIKDKINAPPTNPDDQQVPKSLQRIVELKDKARNGEFRKKKSKTARAKNTFPGGFFMHPDETDKMFLYRVQREINDVKHQAAFEQKFGVEVLRDKEGKVESVVKRPKDPVQIMMKEVRDEKKKKKKGKVEEVRLTKSQKKSLKLKEKKKKRLEGKVDGFEKFQDKVKFGEQVHAPPTLTLPKKASKPGTVPRPGQKDLLLKSMLNVKKTSNKVIDKKGKRKDLPNALRRQLDKQQQEIIQAYRLLKGKKRETD